MSGDATPPASYSEGTRSSVPPTAHADGSAVVEASAKSSVRRVQVSSSGRVRSLHRRFLLRGSAIVGGSGRRVPCERDALRDEWLALHHYRTLRVANADVRDQLEDVLTLIEQTCRKCVEQEEKA